MQSELLTVYNCLISKWSLVDFFGQNFWQTGGLKKKREAVRSPKSREVFNSRRENHIYESITGLTGHPRVIIVVMTYRGGFSTSKNGSFWHLLVVQVYLISNSHDSPLLSPRTTKLWRGYRVCPVCMYVSTYVRMFTRSSYLIYYPISI